MQAIYQVFAQTGILGHLAQQSIALARRGLVLQSLELGLGLLVERLEVAGLSQRGLVGLLARGAIFRSLGACFLQLLTQRLQIGALRTTASRLGRGLRCGVDLRPFTGDTCASAAAGVCFIERAQRLAAQHSKHH